MPKAVRRSFAILGCLMTLLALVFARLPNNKGGYWGKEILESLRKRIKARLSRGSVHESVERGKVQGGDHIDTAMTEASHRASRDFSRLSIAQEDEIEQTPKNVSGD